jgi:peptidoglycan hydrolase CwlO-like protein
MSGDRGSSQKPATRSLPATVRSAGSRLLKAARLNGVREFLVSPQELAKQRETVAELRSELESRRQKLRERRDRLAVRNAQLKERDAKIAEQKAAIQRLNRELTETRDLLASARRELARQRPRATDQPEQQTRRDQVTRAAGR